MKSAIRSALSFLTVLGLATMMLAAPATAGTGLPGIAWSWGSNSGGTLGNGNNTDSNTPVEVLTNGVLAGQSVTQVAAGGSTACAVTAAGGVYCWGDGQSGQFGNGTSGGGLFSNTPIEVDRSGAMSNKSVVQVAVGGSFVCARTSDNSLYCWGNNDFGQLGTGDQTEALTPVAANNGLLAGTEFVELAAGYAYTCAIAVGGDVFCWGNGIYGQLGNGASVNATYPVAVTLNGLIFTKIALGNFTSCAITTDGDAYCWGRNNEGQLGDGTQSVSNVPTPVSTAGVLSGDPVVDIQPGDETTCAATGSGIAVCWGKNNQGQLGNGTTVSSLLPEAVSTSGGLAGKQVTSVGSAYDFGCAANADGSAACWGSNLAGMLGDGTNDDSLTPVAVVRTGQIFQDIVASGYNAYSWSPISTPTITSVTPATGEISPGQTVTITGTGLTGTSVTIGGYACTNVVVISNSELTCTAPAGPVGTVDVVVTGLSGTATLTNAFTYAATAKRCALTIKGARAAKKKLPVGKTVTLVKSSKTGSGCVVQFAKNSTRSLAGRGDTVAAVTIKVVKRTGKVTARANVRGAKAVVRIQAVTNADDLLTDSAIWKRKWQS